MLRQGRPFTSRFLAKTAGIWLGFPLLHHLYIRRRIGQLRAQQQAHDPRTKTVGTDEPSSAVRTLTTQLAELQRRHPDAMHRLREALEVTHGDTLQLRRRLGHRGAAEE